MIYKCNVCGTKLLTLQKNGDQVNLDFVCQKCLSDIKLILKQAADIEKSLLKHIAQTS